MKRFTIFDYPILQQWGEKRKFPPPPIEFLPSTGYINGNFCAGFLYKTDSKICWLEWIISNPETDKLQRDRAIDELIIKLIEDARECGFNVIFSSVEHKGLIDRYKKHNFMETDKEMTNMILRIN